MASAAVAASVVTPSEIEAWSGAVRASPNEESVRVVARKAASPFHRHGGLGGGGAGGEHGGCGGDGEALHFVRIPRASLEP
jgi:hypothetical protein